jgi:beta-1,4-mannosyl-glycoprotein beta-1,4-N-acetylglucosaminyltransferase
MSDYIPKIFDCVTFWNENLMLKARIEFLYSFVDKFVIVESNREHNGSLKKFLLDKEALKDYWDKIIYIQDTNAPLLSENTWAIENHHRNCITQGLKGANPEDIICISDLDEIWNAPQYCELLKNDFLKHGEATSCEQLSYNYFVNICSLSPCIGTVILKKSTLDLFSPQHMRNIKDKLPRLYSAGFHLSYMGGINQIYNKFMTSCDVLDKNEIPSREIICERLKKRLKEGQFNIRHDLDHKVYFTNNPYIPSSITKEKYPEFFINSIDDIKIN